LERLGADEVRDRAASGAALLTARGALILVLGVGANIGLARLLAPRDFGILAIGMALVMVGGYLADGGLGKALIQRPAPPDRAELAAVNALQLALTAGLVLATTAAGALVGEDGLVVAAMVASLPITVLRAPSVIVLERRLRYRVIATTDVVEAVVFYLWALGAVAAGLGTWGLASAVVARALAGTAVILRGGPVGLVAPRWSWRRVRPLVGFGLSFQAAAAVGLARDQGLNLSIAAIAGVTTLGVWNLAWRVLQVPLTLFRSLGRVAFPAMANLLGAGEDPRRAIERGVAATTVATGLLLVGIVGFAPALPALVGDDWGDVPEAILWSSLALVVAAPVHAVIAGYLYAAGQAGAVLRATVLQSIAWLAAALPLLPSLGPQAAGIGWAVGSIAQVIPLAALAARLSGAAIAREAAAPIVAAVGAAAAGWAVASAGGRTLADGILGLATGELLLLALLAVVRRSALRDIFRLVSRVLSEAGRPPRPANSA
jgi:O-antigen/teichoic acid export membrane protein